MLLAHITPNIIVLHDSCKWESKRQMFHAWKPCATMRLHKVPHNEEMKTAICWFISWHTELMQALITTKMAGHIKTKLLMWKIITCHKYHAPSCCSHFKTMVIKDTKQPNNTVSPKDNVKKWNRNQNSPTPHKNRGLRGFKHRLECYCSAIPILERLKSSVHLGLWPRDQVFFFTVKVFILHKVTITLWWNVDEMPVYFNMPLDYIINDCAKLVTKSSVNENVNDYCSVCREYETTACDGDLKNTMFKVQPPTGQSCLEKWWNPPWGKGQPVCNTDNITTICWLNVYSMWEPQHFNNLRSSVL
jgi:hypothetical protein